MAKDVVKVDFYGRPVHEGITFTEPSMTMQEFKYEADLNNIVDKNLHYKDPAFVTKLMLSGKMSDKEPIYGDFADVKDYQTSLNLIMNAQDQFNALPAKVRQRFNNDPAEMLAFCNDVNNIQEGIALGLFDKDLVEKDLLQKASVEFGSTDSVNIENAGVDTVSGPAPETSA